MQELKIPSLLQVARNWRPTPLATKKAILASARGRPSFTYAPLFNSAFDICKFGTPYSDLVAGYNVERREDIRKILLEILALLDSHYRPISPDFVNPLNPQEYPISRDHRIPLQAPFLYGINGRLHVPVFMFWRVKSLNVDQMALFATLALETLSRNPDLRDAQVDLLDFSAPNSKQPRILKVQNAKDIPRLNSGAFARALSIFVEGFEMAKAEWKPAERKSAEANKQSSTRDQLILFDGGE